MLCISDQSANLDKAADRTEWQGLVEKLEATGEEDDSDESITEAED